MLTLSSKCVHRTSQRRCLISLVLSSPSTMFFHIICRVCAILPVAKSVSSIQTAAMHPTSLLSILVSLFLFRQRAHAECEPVGCGNLSIKYPFWLGAPSRPPPEPSCGHPAFELWCINSNTTACISGSPIHIHSIDYGASSFVVYHNRVATGTDGVCLADFNVSSTLALSPLRISPSNRALCFLFNCNGKEPRGREYANATAGCKRPIVAYLGGSYDRDTPPAIPTGNCTYRYLPVLGSEAAVSTAANYSRLLKAGFLLDWAGTGSIGDCPACIASGGQCRYRNAIGALACLCPDSKLHGPTCAGSKGTSKMIMLIAVTSAAGALLFTCIYVLVWRKKGKRLRFLLCKKTSSNTEKNYEAMIVSYGSLAPKRYMYSEVMKITSSRSDQLGKGGYGVVFKGRLHDGSLVAVKFLHDCKGNGDEFVNEVMRIGRTSHVNVVSLYGFCLEGSKRALIYEYMPNGSLDKYVYSEHPKEILGWERLYGIAIGIARGLEYLHHSCNTRIVHFDIKPQNILLDKYFSPKIADFGLAKLCHTKESKVSMTGTRGTIGFIAPEVHSRTFGVVSTKSDVYSYGMMLLEMVGGRRNVKSIVAKSSEKYFPDWIYDHYAQDDGLKACEVTSEIEDIARKMTLIGLWCVQILPAYRPTITKVLEMFERSSDDMDMPPKQNFSGLL
ncbi:LEAF RUST 10 DISEASE-RESISTANCEUS RECEPTOR-LIKE PROTEIN KINASE-like 2.4 [Triticum aestivum]|uniref:LEAF RUST 10 DISEASE-RESISTANCEUS RECEPTOR-LIKE PROTEIN KINASE-like 2.4 n=1 Tax=Triticum aestivum TaxID=4565 RepID=UPI001D005E03|nr:LEAF RUST 10 DISEASE-RESISTANCE LOCUS RECEPTOR-LIKE PROTEIN KINASE-like 2.4 [Triticum aestivum]